MSDEHSMRGGVEIPCGQCGQPMWVPMQLAPVLGVQCLGCGQPVLLHFDALANDMSAAHSILVAYRRSMLAQ